MIRPDHSPKHLHRYTGTFTPAEALVVEQAAQLTGFNAETYRPGEQYRSSFDLPVQVEPEKVGIVVDFKLLPQTDFFQTLFDMRQASREINQETVFVK